MLTKTYTAAAAIGKYRIAKFDAEGQVSAATAATDEAVGVTTDIPAAPGERCDIVHNGEGFVTAGGAIGAGKCIVAGADGKAVQVAPAAGSTVRLIGMALESATADGDIIRAFIYPVAFKG